MIKILVLNDGDTIQDAPTKKSVHEADLVLVPRGKEGIYLTLKDKDERAEQLITLNELDKKMRNRYGSVCNCGACKGR